MIRLLTLGVLALAFVSTQGEARSKRIHVTAKVEETTLIGDPAEPKIGDQRITRVVLFDPDKHKKEVGTGTGICTLVKLPIPSEEDALVQCYITATLDNKGQIIFGGTASLPIIGAVGHFGIFGGTDDFHKARGEATLTVISLDTQDAVFDLE
jgi:hypothetical protein